MIIAYFSNFLNHHQKLVADELASTEGIDYIFVETVPMYDWLKEVIPTTRRCHMY